MLEGLFASLYGTTITIPAFLIVSALSLVLGFAIALCHRRTAGASGSMSGALTFLPFLVQLVILLVNGNLGAGVAVAGAFSLIRFRSAPGSARDITTIFLAMTVGLACGMGYAALAVLAAGVVCGLTLLERLLPLFREEQSRSLKITIPEDLDYDGLFDDLLEQYTTRAELTRVKTANMGSLYCLHYRVCLKDLRREKEFLDQLRCRNGNLEISCGKVPEGGDGKEL